ncbi:MAG TPA: SpoIIE family protein phosphatase [Spirochaetota bacterium]|jgi:CRP-like cAMP-binding protein|nr:SpoIIE family protein phosphatase [Spirochaetota bacterium]
MSKEDYVEIINALRTIPSLKNLTLEELKVIAPFFVEKKFHTGDFIIVEGTSGNAMYIIKNGTVIVTKSDKKGEQITLGVLRDGDFFGEFSLFDNLPRSANVAAIDDTTIFVLTREDFDNICKDNITIANKIYFNTLLEVFSRFRKNISNFTFSQYHLREKSEMLNKINRDLSSAQEIQQYFINVGKISRELMGIKHSYVYQPSEAVGGDFIDIIEKGSKIYMIIADVEGHGITAALVTGVLKSAFVMLVPLYGDDPCLFLSRLNNHLYNVIHSIHATCYYTVIDTDKKEITFAKAGHHHPLFWNSNKNAFEDINPKGPGLGIVLDPVYSICTLPYSSGDKLLFFTDGIIEQRNRDGQMYSLERLQKVFLTSLQNKESNTLNVILKDLYKFSNHSDYEDDITLMLYEFL